LTLNRRMTVTAGVAVIFTSTVMYPVFTDSLWFAASIGAVVTVAAVGALTRLRSLPAPVCLAASVAGLLLYLNLVFEARYSFLLVIPTRASVSSLWHLTGTGFNDASRYAPPVPNLPGLLLLAAAGVGITAVLTDLIAVRLRSTALAGLPLLVLFTVPVTLNAPHSQLVTGLVFCLGGAGYLAMLSADGRERIRVWGRLVSLWRTGPWLDAAAADGTGAATHPGGPGAAAHPGGPGAAAYPGGADDAGTGGTASRIRGPGSGPDTRALAAAGRRVGLASIVLALCVPLLVPGLHPSKLFSSGPGIGGTGTGTGALSLPSTLSQAVNQLRDTHPSVEFSYTTTASASVQSNDAQYFRQYVFDTLADGIGWEVAGYTDSAVPAETMPQPQGLADVSSPPQVKTVVTASKNFTTVGSQPTFLPLVYPVTQFHAPGDWLADSDLMVYSAKSSIADQSYSEVSLDVDPTTEQLGQLGKPANAPNLAPDLQLPPSYETSALKKLAQKYASGQDTEIGEVDALANWLSGSQFRYNLGAALFNSADGLQSFLTKSKTGFCVQSAYAMTVLSRLLGIPARFVVGYTSGTRMKNGTYQVMNTDAHAWSEVYFPTFGWLRFEPTPSGQGTARATNYMGSTTGTGQISPDPVVSATGAAGQQKTGQPRGQFGRTPTQPGATGTASGVLGRSAGTPWAAVALAVVAAMVLAGAIVTMIAPPALRTLPSAATSPARRRKPVTVTSITLAAAAAALIALALYRLLSGTSGLNLGAGWATIGLAFGLAAAVALTGPSIARIALRRWRWMRAGDDASRAHAAWREFHDDLTDYGITCPASEPPRTLAARVTTGLTDQASQAIRRLALAEERARYAASPSGSGTLRQDGATARGALAATAGSSARWRARIFPASLITALADATARLPDHLATRLPRHHSTG
jgi:transglutaminase-like putative cysteine protease